MNKTTIATIGVSILAIMIAVVSLNHSLFVKPVVVPSAPTVKGVDACQDTCYFPYGFNLGGQGAALGKNINAVLMPLMGANQNQVAWLNNTGVTVYAMNYVGELLGSIASGVASSSGNFNFYVGTSSAATSTDGVPPGFTGTLVDTFNIATNTLPTASVINSDVKGGTKGQGVIAVPNGVYLIAALESSSSPVSATSTTRGFNVQGSFDYTY